MQWSWEPHRAIQRQPKRSECEFVRFASHRHAIDGQNPVAFLDSSNISWAPRLDPRHTVALFICRALQDWKVTVNGLCSPMERMSVEYEQMPKEA